MGGVREGNPPRERSLERAAASPDRRLAGEAVSADIVGAEVRRTGFFRRKIRSAEHRGSSGTSEHE